MKPRLLILLLLFSTTIVYSQTNTFIIKVIDNTGQMDSVIMGFRDIATTGIDESLGESDYYGKPYSDLDIRSIQRDTITKDTLWLNSYNGSHLVEPFLSNVDLKLDFRKNTFLDHFIIQVRAIKYPITIKLAFFNFEQHISYCSYTNYTEDNLVNGELKNLFYGQGKDSITVFKDSSENRLIGFHPFIIESINFQNGNKSSFYITPNPVIETIHLNLFMCEKQRLTIFNSNGVIFESLMIQNNIQNINVSNYPTGLYFIRVGTITKKFIKL
jgi:hypothetical protein